VGARGKVVIVFETASVNQRQFPATNVIVHEERDASAHLDVCCLCILLVMAPSFEKKLKPVLEIENRIESNLKNPKRPSTRWQWHQLDHHMQVICH